MRTHLHDPMPSNNSIALVTRERDGSQWGRLTALGKAQFGNHTVLPTRRHTDCLRDNEIELLQYYPKL